MSHDCTFMILDTRPPYVSTDYLAKHILWCRWKQHQTTFSLDGIYSLVVAPLTAWKPLKEDSFTTNRPTLAGIYVGLYSFSDELVMQCSTLDIVLLHFPYTGIILVFPDKEGTRLCSSSVFSTAICCAHCRAVLAQIQWANLPHVEHIW